MFTMSIEFLVISFFSFLYTEHYNWWTWFTFCSQPLPGASWKITQINEQGWYLIELHDLSFGSVDLDICVVQVFWMWCNGLICYTPMSQFPVRVALTGDVVPVKDKKVTIFWKQSCCTDMSNMPMIRLPQITTLQECNRVCMYMLLRGKIRLTVVCGNLHVFNLCQEQQGMLVKSTIFFPVQVTKYTMFLGI